MTPVGILLARSGEVYWPHCSAVLVDENAVLTAAHCVRGIASAGDLKVFMPFEGIRELAEEGINVPCDSDQMDCHDDVAVLELANPYSRTPVAQQAAGDPIVPRTRATAVGFGASNVALSDRGLMHQGSVTLSECNCGDFEEIRSHTLCFKVDFGPDPPSLEQFANFGGDSGGALFAKTGESFELLGISSGYRTDCVGSVIEGRYTDVRKNHAREVFSSAFCGPDCPAPTESGYAVLLGVELAYVDKGDITHHIINVVPGTHELLINLNHETAGFDPEPGTDLSLEIPAPLHSDCSRFYGVESCRVLNPPPGEYMIGVKKNKGNPAYQLTAVAIREKDDGDGP
jgi:hypothetical protein